MEGEFLHASRRAEASRARRARVAVTALIVLLIGALTATGVAVAYARNARHQQLLALSRQLAAESDSLATGDPYTSMLLATAALHVAPTSEAQYSVRNVLPSPGVP